MREEECVKESYLDQPSLMSTRSAGGPGVGRLIRVFVPIAKEDGENCLKMTHRMVHWPRRSRTFEQAVG